MLTYSANAQIRRDLLDAFIEAKAPSVAYPAVFPQLAVPSRAGAIKVLPFSQVNTSVTAITRTPGQAYEEGSAALESVAYQCEDIGHQISMDMAQEYPVNAEAGVAQTIRYRLEAAVEANVANLIWNSTTGIVRAANNNVTTLTTAWSNPAVDPVADVMSAAEVIASQTGGFTPNVMVVSPQVFVTLKTNPAIVGRMSYMVDRSDEAVANALAPIFGVQKVVVARARQGTSQVWDADYTLLCVAAEPDSLASEPSGGRMVYWAEDGDISNGGWIVETIDDEITRSHIVRARRNASFVTLSVGAFYGLIQP